MTRLGYIYIGHGWGGPYGAYLTSSPVRVKAVKAVTLGRIYNAIDAEIIKGPVELDGLPSVIPLDLDVPHGSVTVRYK